MLDGARLLDDASLPAETKARLLVSAADHVERHALRSGALHPLTALCIMPSSFDDDHPTLFWTLFAVMAVFFAIRVALILGIRRRPPARIQTRVAWFVGPWLVSCATFTTFCTSVVAFMPGTWVSVAICAASGLGGLSAVIYFAPYTRATLVYALLMASPPGLTELYLSGPQGPGLVMGYMWAVFVALVVPSLNRLSRDYWGGLVGRALLEERARAATEESARKTEFLAHVSHELRTPLNGILGMTRLILDGDIDRSSRSSASAVLRAGESMLRLLNELLDRARADEGRLQIEARPFVPASLLEDAVGLFSGAAQERGIALELEADDGLPRSLLGDGPRIRQIVQNLVANAVRLTERGRVVVRAVSERVDEHTRLTVEVEDTGVGFPPEDAERLFERFSPSASRRLGSSGLGLYLSRELARRMGGDVTARSRGPGHGAVFTLVVTLTEPITATEPHGRRALLADDDELSLRITASMLERLGYTLDLARTGTEALDAARRRGPFDVLVLDCMMPGMSGCDVAREVRTSSEVPIVVVTANAEALADECAAAGVDEVLAKPVDLDRLTHAVLGAIAKRTRRVA